MSVMDQILDPDNIKKLAEKVGLDPGDVMSAAKKLLPKISGGIKGMFSDDGPKVKGDPWTIFMEAASGKTPKALLDGEDVKKGNKVLEAAFGGKDGSRAVAEETAKETGVDVDAIKKMLPGLASMLMGQVQEHGKESSEVDTPEEEDGSVDWKAALGSDQAKNFLKNLL